MQALQFEPTGRKKRVERFFFARCSQCGEIYCPSDMEPWGWAKDVSASHAHGQVVVQMKVVECRS